MESNLRTGFCLENLLPLTEIFACDRMFSPMAGKKKNKSATAPKRKGKPSKAKAQPTPRRPPARKAKAEDIVLPVLNADKLKELYATMMKCRMLAERVQRSNHSHRLASGLEAILVGAAAHLMPKDCMALEHGGFLASLIKGTPLQLIAAQIAHSQSNNGHQTSASPLREGSSAVTPSMAIGLSLAQKQKSTGTVTLMFGTQEPGAQAFEPAAMTIAATQKLPIVCLVETGFDAQAETHILPVPSDSHGVGSGYYPKIAVDGCDVVGVFRVAQEAIRRAREGHGPALIECMTSRANRAAGDSGTRKIAQYTAEDPLPFMEKYLKRRDLWSAEWSRRIIKDFTKELNDAFAAVHEKPGTDAAFDNVYSADSSNASHTV
jgi:TPP-dependent pyruvate/acetoin dehydrogenase alpha subunit